MALRNLIIELGGNPDQRRARLWITKDYVSVQIDTEFVQDIVVGKQYTLWVAAEDGKTQTGKPVKRGEWFIVSKE